MTDDQDTGLANTPMTSGVIQVSDDVFVNITRICISEIDGVARLTTGPSRGLAGFFRGADAGKGVRIDKLDRHAEDRITLDVHLVLEKDVSIPKVCGAVQHALKETIERMLDKEVERVNVYVEGIESMMPEPPIESESPELEKVEGEIPAS